MINFLSLECRAGLLSLITATCITVVAASCGLPSGPPNVIQTEAQEIWKAHEAAVERAIEGQQENDEFVRAVNFFAEVAGIEIDVNIYTLGYLPTPSTEKDLERVREWYSTNHHRLALDPSTHSVVVRPGKAQPEP